MRFWIDRASLKKNHFLIKGDLYHHICRVCKIKKGEKFELYCEGVQKYEVFLDQVSKDKAQAQILASHPAPALKKPYLNLALSLPKPAVFESVLESSVQMGVKRVQPLLSELSFFRKKSALSPDRSKRWRRIIQHSLAQTGRTEELEISEPKALSQLKIPEEDRTLIAYEAGQNDLKDILLKEKATPEQIWLFIGSEGGFTLRELEAFQKVRPGARVFSMGDQILKVKTAILFGLSVLKYHYNL